MPSSKVLAVREIDVQRFWAKVALPNADGCMSWTGNTDRKGYGIVALRQPDRSVVRTGAHRISCLIANGSPEDPTIETLHGCRNHDCVAPEHVGWGTNADNQADTVRDDTHTRGLRQPAGKLTEAQALEVFESRESYAVIATRFGVSRSLVAMIKGGYNRSYVTGKTR